MADDRRRGRLKKRLQRARRKTTERVREAKRRAAGDDPVSLDREPLAGEPTDAPEVPESESWPERPSLGGLERSRRDRLKARLSRRPRSERRLPSLPRGLKRSDRIGLRERAARAGRPSFLDRIKLPETPGFLIRIKEGFGVVPAALAAAAGAIGAGWDALMERWRGLSLIARRRIVAVVGVAAAVAAIPLLVVPNAPCAFPGGEDCPPGDDLISLVPDNALAYVHLNVREGDQQYEATKRLAGELPQLAVDLGSVVPALSDLTVGFDQQVNPWAGDEIGISVFPEGLGVAQVTLVETEDEEGALAYASEVLGPGVTESALSGISITTDTQGQAYALVEGFLAIGDRAAVGRVVRVGAGELEPLSRLDAASDLLDRLPDRQLLSAYASEIGVGLAERSGTLGAFDTFIDASASDGAAAAISVEGDTVELAVESALDPEEVELNPGVLSTLTAFEPELPQQVGDDAMTMLAIGDAKTSLGRLLSQAASGAPGLIDGLQRFNRRIQDGDGPSVDERLLELLGSETALTVEPPTTGAGDTEPIPGIVEGVGTPYLGVLAREVDKDVAKETLAGLQEQIAAALGQDATFTSLEIGGIETQALRVSRAVELAYGFDGDTLIAGSKPVAIERFASEGASLADDERFNAATRDFPDAPGLLLYFDLKQLVALGEAAGLAVDQSFSSRAPELRRLNDAALVVNASPDSLRTEVRMILGEPPAEPAEEVELPGVP